MSDSEKISFIQFLAAESHKKDEQNHSLQQTIDALCDRLSTMQLTLDEIQRSQHDTRAENIELTAQLSRQGANLKSIQSELKKALGESAKYRGLYEVLRDEKFVGTSQKSCNSRRESGRDDNKGDWDGTNNIGGATSATGSVVSGQADTNGSACPPSDSSNASSVVEPRHVRDRFQKALLQGRDELAQPFMNWIGKLYCIDNSIAERSIRLMTIGRKNKMVFGSHKGAESSAVYHTFIATCKMRALSFRQFLKSFFTAFMEGRTDFENLALAMLGKIN